LVFSRPLRWNCFQGAVEIEMLLANR
jgi:hypothetical protein